MSKRDMRARKLLLAVLLAMSMQSYYAAPTWAAEAGQPAGQTDTVDGKGQGTTTAAPATEEETSAPATGEEAAAVGEDGADTDVAVPPVTYGVRSASAGTGNDIMTLAAETLDDGTVVGGVTFSGGNIDLGGVWDLDKDTYEYVPKGGQISGVTTINGIKLEVDSAENNMIFGSHLNSSSNKFATGFGYGVRVDGEADRTDVDGTYYSGGSSAFGSNASADRGSSAFGANAIAENGMSSAFGAGAHAGGVSSSGSAFGYNAKALDHGALAVGIETEVTAVGGIAIGAYAKAEHENSIAIGSESVTSAANQVSFGKSGSFRSLVNIADIKMNGALTGVTAIEMNGALTGVTSINNKAIVEMEEDKTNKSLSIGTGAGFSNSYDGTVYKNAVAIGNGTQAYANSVAIGSGGYNGGSTASENSVAINGNAYNNSVVIGGTMAGNGYNVGMGVMATSDSDYTTFIGYGNNAMGNGAVALGAFADSEYRGSVSIGAGSYATAENQVNFGYYAFNDSGNDINRDIYYGRSLAGISDITIVADDTAANANNKTTIAGGTITVGGAADDQTVIAGGTVTATKFNGVTLGTDGKVNGATITSNSFNGVTLEMDTSSHYKVGNVDVTQMGTNIGGIKRTGDGTDESPYVTDVEGIKFSSGNVNFGGAWSWQDGEYRSTSNGQGELTGVTKINGVNFYANYDMSTLFIGEADAPAGEVSNSVGLGVGANHSIFGSYNIAIGADSSADGTSNTVVGANATVWNSHYSVNDTTSIGSGSRVAEHYGTALGAQAMVDEGHTNSVAIGYNSHTSKENQVAFGDVSDKSSYRSLAGISDIEMTGALTSASINGATVTATKFNGVTLGTDGKVNGATITSNSFNGVTLEQDASSHYKVGNVDVTQLQTDVAGKADTTTVNELSSKVDTAGTDISALQTTVGDSTKGLVKQVSDMDAAYQAADKQIRTDFVSADATLKTDLTKAFGDADTALKNELNTAIGKKADKATTLAGYGITDAYTKADANIELAKKVDVSAYDSKMSALDSADEALSGRAEALEATTAGISVDDGTTKLANGFKVGTTAYGMDSTGALTAASITEGGKELSAKYAAIGDVTALTTRVGTAETDIGSLKTATADMATKTQVATDISAAKTTLETAYQAADTQIRTDFAAADAKLKTDLTTAFGNADTALKTELTTEIGKKADKATTLAGYGITDAYTKTETTTAITTATADMATNTQVTKDIGAAKTELTKAFGDADTALKTALETDYKAADATLKSTLETDYKAADAALKTTLETAYQAADATLQSNIDAKVAQNTYAEKMGALDSADAALQDRAGKLEAATAGISVDGGTTKLANGFKVGTTAYGMSSDGALTAATVNGAAITSDSFNGVSIKNDGTVDGVDVSALKATVEGIKNDGVGTADTKGIERTGDGSGTPYTTSIEVNTKISSGGITTNAITASGTVTANEFVENGKALSAKYVDKDTVDTLSGTVSTLNDTVGDTTKGLVKETADLKAEDAKIRTDFASADTNLKNELNTEIGKKANKATTLEGYGITDAYTKAEATTAITTATADMATKTQVATDIGTAKTDLTKAFGDADTALKTELTTAFGNADAALKTDLTKEIDKKANKSTTLEGYGITDAYTKTAADTAISTAKTELTTAFGNADTALKTELEKAYQAADTTLQGAIDNKVAQDAYDSKMSALDSADTDLQDRAGKLEAATAGISVDGGTTKLANGFKVGTTAYGMSSDGALTAATVNGAAITSDSFNGVSIKNDGTVDGVDVSALKATVEGIKNDGVGTADTAGIERTGTGLPGADGASTIIEGKATFSKTGLTVDGSVSATTITDGTAKLTGGKLSGLTAGDITSAVSTEAVTGGQVYTVKSDLETSISGKADTTTVTALDTRVGTAETDIGNLQTATADMATKTQVATDISAAKSTLETAYQAADTKLETDLTKAFGDADTALKTTLETAYQAADTQIKTDFATADAQIRTDFVAADAELKSAVDTKVAQAAYDSKMSALDSADAALSGRADKLEAKTVKFSADGDTLTGMTNITSASATLGGVSFAAGGVVTGVESINTVKFDASGNISDAGTYNSVTIGAAGIGGTDTFNGISIKKEGTSVKVGDIDLTALAGGSSGNTDDISDLQAKTGGIERDTAAAKTTIEKNTSITENGLATNKITVDDVILESGKLTVGSVILTNGTLSGLTDATLNATSTEAVTGKQLHVTNENVTSVTGRMTTAESDIGTLKTTVGDAANGLVKDTAELQSMVKDTTKGLEATNKIAVANAGDIVTLQTATTGMKYDNGTTTFAGGVAATVVTAGEFKVSGTAFGFNSEGALMAASFNGVSIASDGGSGSDVVVGGINLSELNQKSGTTSDNTTGVEHSGGSGADSYTTIEKNTKIAETGIETNAITASGTVTANEFVENGKTLAERYAGKEAFEDVAALVGDDSKGLVKDTKALKAVTASMSYDVDSKSTTFNGNLVVGVASSGTHTQITDSAIIFGEGGNMQVTIDASGIHVNQPTARGISTFAAAADGTHIDHNSLVTGTVTASSINGLTIGTSGGDIMVGDINLSQLKNASGVTNENTEGIKRSDSAGDNVNDTTTIETATSFNKDGMKTANLEAATAAIGGVNFAADGIVSGISSINGVAVSGSVETGLSIGGVTLHGGLVNDVDISWLNQRVDYLEKNGGSGGTGGGGGLNTSGISKPNPYTTVIEGCTSITSSGVTTNNLEVKDELIIGKDDKDQTTINKDGITVGKNNSQSFINGTDGFVSQKGLYIGVGSSGDLASAKFSIDSSSGKLTSNVGGHSFTNSGNGAEFSNSSGTTTIKGGELSTDKLWVGGNEVKVSGNGDVEKNKAINNQLSNNKDGYDYTNSFTTSEVGGTTQSATKESDADNDKKEKWETTNNTSAGGTSITTTKTSTNSADRKTEQSSSFVTNESGMSLNTSTKVTDKDGNVTKNTSGETKMSGDSLTVSKTTVTSKDGKDETTTSSTTVGSGEVTLHREDGSTIRVGEAIEGMQGQIQDIGSKVNEMGVEIKEVGALSAALAGLHPQPENANSRADFAMAMGSYEGKQALAVGGFYRPDKRTMLSIGASTTSSKHMMNMGISIALDRLPEEKRKAQEAAAADPETLNKVLERLAALEQDNQRLQADNKKRDIAYEKLAADYTQLKEKYTEKTAEKQQSETKMEEAAPAEADSSSGE
ncbi:MAG: YadA-like family protein [Acidaminococcaceae bacterium]|nr:YadA-like family protein [Acidaminococcaceae bacterium]